MFHVGESILSASCIFHVSRTCDRRGYAIRKHYETVNVIFLFVLFEALSIEGLADYDEKKIRYPKLL